MTSAEARGAIPVCPSAELDSSGSTVLDAGPSGTEGLKYIPAKNMG